MTDGHLMDTNCVHGVAWFECAECESDPPLLMWVIYYKPADFPHGFIARKWEFASGEFGTHGQPTEDVMRSGDLLPLQAVLHQMGFVRIERMPNDDPVIVEVWV